VEGSGMHAMPPKPKRRRDGLIGVRVARTELARWHRVAALAGMSLAELTREAIRHYARVLERESLAVPTATQTGAEAS
jgi:hypothetical protein